MRRLSFAAPVLLFVCLLLAAWLHASPFQDDRVLRLDRADFALAQPLPGDGRAARPPSTGWSTVSLPDSWRRDHPGLGGFAWYRAHFQLDTLPSHTLAVYIPHLSLIGQLWLNGSLLNPDAHFDVPNGKKGAAMSDAPLFIVLPSGLFKAGDNVLELHLQGEPGIRSGVSAISIGPTSVLRPVWRQRYAIQVVAPYVILVLMAAAMCFLASYLWRQRRLFIVQLAMVISVIVLISYLGLQLPITRVDEQALRLALGTFLYWALCMAGYRLARADSRLLRFSIHGIALLILGADAVLAMAHMADDRIWLLAMPLPAVETVVIGLMLRHAWREHSLQLWSLALAAAFWWITVIQSNLLPTDWLPWDNYRLSIVGALPFCVVLLFYFAQHFILEREQAIRDQHSAIASERTRILQDMHDGMGAHLIIALRLARKGDTDLEELAQYIEESLQDLRLIIDSLDLDEHDLLPLLGNLRFRLEPRLRKLGVTLEWDVQPIPDLPYLTPESALSILRIVQEAINNALKHSGSTMIQLSVAPLPHCVRLCIADLGQGGATVELRPGSHGLANMRMRAARLGAKLAMYSDARGTGIVLDLPLG
jgi:signal transduction histidine kinase